MDAEMMNGLFSGANFSGEVQIVVAPRGRVVFKEEAASGERGAVSGERIVFRFPFSPFRSLSER